MAVVAGIQQKIHRKHLAHSMSPYTQIILKPGPSQGQIPPFKPACYTTQKRHLLKLALSSLRVYTSSIIVLQSTGSVSLILPDMQFGTFHQNPVRKILTGELTSWATMHLYCPYYVTSIVVYDIANHT